MDDAVAHERLALWPATESRWAVRILDGDEWLEDFDGADPETGPCRSQPLRRRTACVLPLYRLRERMPDAQQKAAMIRGPGCCDGAGR